MKTVNGCPQFSEKDHILSSQEVELINAKLREWAEQRKCSGCKWFDDKKLQGTDRITENDIYETVCSRIEISINFKLINPDQFSCSEFKEKDL